VKFEGTPAGFGFTLEVKGVEGVIARLGTGEARMGVNGVSDSSFSISARSIGPTLLRRRVEGERGGVVGCPCVGMEVKAEGGGGGVCLDDDVEVPKYEATEREVTA
jgi:hypothetical protein